MLEQEIKDPLGVLKALNKPGAMLRVSVPSILTCNIHWLTLPIIVAHVTEVVALYCVTYCSNLRMVTVLYIQCTV